MNEDIMKALGLHREVRNVKEGCCPICEEPIDMDDFRDELSRREFRISGMCQKCQDRIFVEPE